jgi:hypothetical protein
MHEIKQEIKSDPDTGEVEIAAAQRKLTRIRSGMMGALCLALGVIPDANDPRMEHFSDDSTPDDPRGQTGQVAFDENAAIPLSRPQGYRIERRASDLALSPPVAVMPSRQRMTIDERKRKAARKVSRAARKKNRK